MILELSGDFPVSLLCEKMGIQRSSFCNWKHTLAHPAERTKALLHNLALFEEYHLRYPSHGYRWLNAKIRLDTGTVMSDPYAHKCCKTLGVKSEAKHYKYKKPGNPFKIYPNLLMAEMQLDRPLQCVVSDMKLRQDMKAKKRYTNVWTAAAALIRVTASKEITVKHLWKKEQRHYRLRKHF